MSGHGCWDLEYTGGSGEMRVVEATGFANGLDVVCKTVKDDYNFCDLSKWWIMVPVVECLGCCNRIP